MYHHWSRNGTPRARKLQSLGKYKVLISLKSSYNFSPLNTLLTVRVGPIQSTD